MEIWRSGKKVETVENFRNFSENSFETNWNSELWMIKDEKREISGIKASDLWYEAFKHFLKNWNCLRRSHMVAYW